MWSFYHSSSVPNGGVPNGGVPNGGVPNGGVPNGGVPNGGVLLREYNICLAKNYIVKLNDNYY